MSDVQVISGTRRAIKEMSDGTIRVQIDIDPRFRSMFWSLFPNIDMPVALAPLVADFEKREPEPEKPKGGALAKLAGILCSDPEFQNFIGADDDEQAAQMIRKMCDIGSRAELDSDPVAEKNFHEKIRGPWLKYRASKGLK